MWRAFLVALILFLPAQLTCGQALDPPTPIFPSDGKPPAETNGAELLQAVCPGEVEVGEKIGCGKHCPSFTIFGDFGMSDGWSLTRVTRGHLLSPTSNDAVLSMEGCEPQSQNFGGTILLTRGAQEWTMEWYRSGIETSQCHKVPLQNSREILVCVGRWVAPTGHSGTDLYVEDLLSPVGSLMASDGSPFSGQPITPFHAAKTSRTRPSRSR
jgi:hypothetical protein